MIHQLEPWPQFLKRKDNIGLSIMEAKQKYLEEQLEFDNFVSQQNSTLQGEANGVELVSYDYDTEEEYTGPERYRNFPSCNPTSLDIFAQDFGPMYVDSIVNVDNQTNKVFFLPETSPTQTGAIGLSINIPSYNPFLHGGNPWTVEVIPEYEGRENVLKIYVPPGLVQQASSLQIDPLVGSGPNRGDFVDTHTLSVGMGMWNEGFSWNGLVSSNNFKSVAGSADLLIFLSTVNTGDPKFGTGLSWEKDQWNDLRSEEKLIEVMNSPSFNNFNPTLTSFSLQSEILPYDPVTLYGPEFVWYLSDFNFRVCPL